MEWWGDYGPYFVSIAFCFLIALWMEVFLMRREIRDVLTKIRDALKDKQGWSIINGTLRHQFTKKGVFMVAEALLTALKNTLTDLRNRANQIEVAIKGQSFYVTNAEECLKGAEDAEACAKLEMYKVQNELGALVGHVGKSAAPPKSLQDRICILTGDRAAAQKKYQAATDKLAQAKTNLQTAKTQMKVEEGRLNEIEEQIRQVQNEVIQASS